MISRACSRHHLHKKPTNPTGRPPEATTLTECTRSRGSACAVHQQMPHPATLVLGIVAGCLAKPHPAGGRYRRWRLIRSYNSGARPLSLARRSEPYSEVGVGGGVGVGGVRGAGSPRVRASALPMKARGSAARSPPTYPSRQRLLHAGREEQQAEPRLLDYILQRVELIVPRTVGQQRRSPRATNPPGRARRRCRLRGRATWR